MSPGSALLQGVTFLLACGGEAPAPKTVVVDAPPIQAPPTATEPTEAAPDDATEATAPRRSAPLADAAPTHDLLIPPECEIYLGRMQACVAKLPPEARKTLEDGIQQMRDVWRGVTDESGKQAVRLACQAGAEAWAEMPICK